jgi:hypothetical protein
MSEVEGESLCLGGLTWALHTRIFAAIGCGVAQESILEHERVTPAAWDYANGLWQDAITDSAEGDQQLQDGWDAALMEAKGLYARRVTPLCDSLDSWLDFVRVIQEGGDPVENMSSLGVSPEDCAQLQSLWSKRLAADPELRKLAGERLMQPPGKLPPITVELGPLPPPLRGADAPVIDGVEVPSEDDEEGAERQEEENETKEAVPLPAFEVPAGAPPKPVPEEEAVKSLRRPTLVPEPEPEPELESEPNSIPAFLMPKTPPPPSMPAVPVPTESSPSSPDPSSLWGEGVGAETPDFLQSFPKEKP